jgi:hypothetical protein
MLDLFSTDRTNATAPTSGPIAPAAAPIRRTPFSDLQFASGPADVE